MTPTADALAILTVLLAQRGKLTDEQEAEATEAVMTLVGNALTNLERIAEALERGNSMTEAAMAAQGIL